MRGIRTAPEGIDHETEGSVRGIRTAPESIDHDTEGSVRSSHTAPEGTNHEPHEGDGVMPTRSSAEEVYNETRGVAAFPM